VRPTCRTGGTGYIVAFNRENGVNTPIPASVSDDGVVTVTAEAFDGEMLLSSGSACKFAGGGGSAEHAVLTEGEDIRSTTARARTR
jgi:hypothetical protein